MLNDIKVYVDGIERALTTGNNREADEYVEKIKHHIESVGTYVKSQKKTILTRRGRRVKEEDGTFMLVNDEDMAYRAKDEIANIWSMCDGISFRELVEKIANTTNQNSDSARASVESALAFLRHHKLVDIKIQ